MSITGVGDGLRFKTLFIRFTCTYNIIKVINMYIINTFSVFCIIVNSKLIYYSKQLIYINNEGGLFQLLKEIKDPHPLG